MKRKQRLLSRILLPTIIVLLLFPPISCLIFSHAASKYAYTKASDELKTLQQNILPLMESSFAHRSGVVDSSDADSDITGSKSDTALTTRNNRVFGPKESKIQGGGSTDTATPEKNTVANPKSAENHGNPPGTQIRTFLRQVGPLMHRIGGDAHLIILGGKMQVIYPHDEQERAAVTPLAEDFSDYIQTMRLPETGKAVEMSGWDGKTYLVNIYPIPIKSVQLKYLITYCATSQISAWVHSATLLVLAISSVFVLLVIAVLWLAERSVTKPLSRLCQTAARIGEGSFETIESDFSLQELEDLRMAMNQMSEQLLRSEEIQKTFFQNVSHELRNPLMSISGYAQGIEQGVFHAPKEAAHTIMEESARLTELVNSLLTLSRMENEQQKPALGMIRIIDPIEDCLDRLNGLALKNTISMTLIPFEQSLTVWCEEDLFCKVLENLLTNAIRYAKKTVSVSVITRDSQVQIFVSDDGDGIAEKDLPHLFERCYKGRGGNFGIGLAIAYSAAQKMDGTLTAANRKEGGAVFTLSLKTSE